MDSTALAEGQQQMKRLFKEYGASPLTPLKGLFLQGYQFVCFFLAISNMTENVSSFKNWWSLLGSTKKKISLDFALSAVPLTMTFSKAIFCYWITSNLFSLSYGFALKVPGAMKFLRVPEIPVTQQNTDPPPTFSLFSSQKQATAAEDLTPSGGKEKLGDGRVSSSLVISQRLRETSKGEKEKQKRVQ